MRVFFHILKAGSYPQAARVCKRRAMATTRDHCQTRKRARRVGKGAAADAETETGDTDELACTAFEHTQQVCIAACACLMHNCTVVVRRHGQSEAYRMGKLHVRGTRLFFSFEENVPCQTRHVSELVEIVDPSRGTDTVDRVETCLRICLAQTCFALDVDRFGETSTSELFTSDANGSLIPFVTTVRELYTRLLGTCTREIKCAGDLIARTGRRSAANARARRARPLFASLAAAAAAPAAAVFSCTALSVSPKVWAWYAPDTVVRCMIYEEAAHSIHASGESIAVGGIEHRMSVSHLPDGTAHHTQLMICCRHSTCDNCARKASGMARDGVPHVSALAFVRNLAVSCGLSYEARGAGLEYAVRGMHPTGVQWIRNAVHGDGRVCLFGCGPPALADTRREQDVMRTMPPSTCAARRKLVARTCERVVQDITEAVQVYETGHVFLSTPEDRKTLTCLAACRAYFQWLLQHIHVTASSTSAPHNLMHIVHARDARDRYVHVREPSPHRAYTTDSTSGAPEAGGTDAEAAACPRRPFGMFVCLPPGDVCAVRPVCFGCRSERCCCAGRGALSLATRDVGGATDCEAHLPPELDRIRAMCTRGRARDARRVLMSSCASEWSEGEVRHAVVSILHKRVFQSLGIEHAFEKAMRRRQLPSKQREHQRKGERADCFCPREIDEGVRLWNMLLLASQPRCPCCRTLSVRSEGCMHVCCFVCATHYCSSCLRVYPLDHNPDGSELHGVLCKVGREAVYKTFALGAAQTFATLRGAVVKDAGVSHRYSTAVGRTPNAWLHDGMKYSDRFSHNTPPLYHMCCPQFAEEILEHELHSAFGLFALSYRDVVRADLEAVGRSCSCDADKCFLTGVDLVYRVCAVMIRFDCLYAFGVAEAACASAEGDSARNEDFTFWTLVDVVGRLVAAGGTGFQECLGSCGWSPLSVLAFIHRHRLAFTLTILIMSGTPVSMLERVERDGADAFLPAFRDRWSTYVSYKVSASSVEKMMTKV